MTFIWYALATVYAVLTLIYLFKNEDEELQFRYQALTALYLILGNVS